MIVKVILWGSNELLKAMGHQGLSVGQHIYEKNHGQLVEYLYIDTKEQEELLAHMRKLRYQRIFLVVEELSEKHLKLLESLKQEKISFYLFIKERKLEEASLKKANIEHWCYLPVFEHHLFLEVIRQLLETEDGSIQHAFEGGTLLIGEVDEESQSWGLMQQLFKKWHYVQQSKHIRLNLYSKMPIAIERLCEVEDAAVQYMAEESRFQLRQYEDHLAESSIYYILEAYE